MARKKFNRLATKYDPNLELKRRIKKDTGFAFDNKDIICLANFRMQHMVGRWLINEFGEEPVINAIFDHYSQSNDTFVEMIRDCDLLSDKLWENKEAATEHISNIGFIVFVSQSINGISEATSTSTYWINRIKWASKNDSKDNAARFHKAVAKTLLTASEEDLTMLWRLERTFVMLMQIDRDRYLELLRNVKDY